MKPVQREGTAVQPPSQPRDHIHTSSPAHAARPIISQPFPPIPPCQSEPSLSGPSLSEPSLTEQPSSLQRASRCCAHTALRMISELSADQRNRDSVRPALRASFSGDSRQLRRGGATARLPIGFW
ncbi:hypothetical protein MHYP_G00133710 [Metynnis hypsauchen]